MRKVCELFATLNVVLLSAGAQIVIDTTNPIQFGIYAHGALTRSRTGGFTQLGTISKPPVPFRDAWGDGIAFGGLVNSPLSSLITANQTTAAIHLGLRVGFALQFVQLAANEQQRFIVGGIPTSGSIIHTVRATFASFGGEAMVELTPPFHENFRIHAGTRVAWVYSATFRQTENLYVPQTRAVFIGSGETRRIIEDDIPNARKHEVYALAGISYNIPIEKRFALVPEIMVAVPLATHTSDLPWRSSWLRAGIAVKVTIPTSKPIVHDTLTQRDTIIKVIPTLERDTTVLLSVEHRLTINETEDVRYEYVHRREVYERRLQPSKEPEKPSASIKVLERLPDSTYAELDTLRCREIVWTDFHPLLPYIFFDYGSSTISTRYQQLTRMDAERYIPIVSMDQMHTYYSLLNIIGRGLRNNPAVELRIKGCVSRREQQHLQNWRQLAQQRAEAIGQYFIQSWGIDPKRIIYLPVGLPSKPSNERSDDGVMENQRVELYSSSDELMQPVMMRDTMLESRATHLRLLLHLTAKSPIIRWQLEISHAKRVLYKNTGTGECPEVMDIALSADLMRRLVRTDTASLVISLRLEQQGNKQTMFTRQIPLKVETLEQLRSRQQITEVDRYILMLFDAGRAEPSRASRSLIEYIRGRIQPGSNVSVIGSTDRTGSLQYNIELSKRRARAVAALLEYPAKRVEGIGPDTTSYDNNTPEGRFHARTVKIEVERPYSYRALLDRRD
ncbi:MAG: OmpA family protein [Chlorobi bacterium]|nr:OmpA family protein [Chlorobiota bacterium]